ncbi:MAG: hypothetical protein AAB065_00140 [Deltaproteobacteria bacterium]
MQSSLARLFSRQAVADLDALRSALGTTSRTTVFRALSSVGYRTSYSHAGRFYTLEDIPRFDDDGLWAHGGVLFSRDRTLRQTVVRMVGASPSGHTHPELQARLRLRVHDTLLDLVEKRQVDRVVVERLFLYVSADQERAAAQVASRVQVGRGAVPIKKDADLDPAAVIDVLAEVIHGTVVRLDARDVVERLAARGVAVTAAQVEWVFQRHGVRKKTVPSRSPRSRR